jgi:hypothetical protein
VGAVKRTRLPLYVDMPTIRDLLGGEEHGWTTEKATRWLAREGAVIRRGGRKVTTEALLRATFPEVWDKLEQWAFEQDLGPNDAR